MALLTIMTVIVINSIIPDIYGEELVMYNDDTFNLDSNEETNETVRTVIILAGFPMIFGLYLILARQERKYSLT